MSSVGSLYCDETLPGILPPIENRILELDVTFNDEQPAVSLVDYFVGGRADIRNGNTRTSATVVATAAPKRMPRTRMPVSPRGQISKRRMPIGTRGSPLLVK